MPLDQTARVEIDPVRLALGQLRVGRDLDGRDRSAERRAAPGAEQHELRAGRRENRHGDHVVAGAGQQIQPRRVERFAVIEHVRDLRRAAFLGAAERFFLQRRDAARLVAGGRVLVDDLIVPDEVVLETVHHRRRAAEGLLIPAATFTNSSII